MKNIKYDFNDILIVPEFVSTIESRKQININKTINDVEYLPLMTAPMDTVISLDNCEMFVDLGYLTVLPRTIKFDEIYDHFMQKKGSISSKVIKYEEFISNVFVSVSLNEFENIINGFNPLKNILVDIANGHIGKIKDLAIKYKEKFPNTNLMIGNIANPLTYKYYAECQAIDYIRCGVGNGGGCWIDGTLIKTENGYKKIEDILINDKVLTHDGTYHSVTNKISYINDCDKLIKINGDICTPDHELYVINIEDSIHVNDNNYTEYGYWLIADKVDSNKHLIVSL